MFTYNCPSPEEDNEIIVVTSDNDIHVLKHDKANSLWRDMNALVTYFDLDARFVEGQVKWIYKKDFTRSLIEHARHQIKEEIS